MEVLKSVLLLTKVEACMSVQSEVRSKEPHSLIGHSDGVTGYEQ